MNIFIGCTMIESIEEKFKESAYSLATELANNGHNLVFGACNYGLMGIVYRTMKEKNRHVTGVIAEMYRDDLLELDCDETVVVNTIVERNNKFLEYANAIVFLEGGTGTLGELFTILEAKKSTDLDIPIVIFNGNGYYTYLLEQLNEMFKCNMLKEKEFNNFHVSNSVEDCINYLNSYNIPQ